MEYYNYGYLKGDIIKERIGAPDSQIFDLSDAGGYLFVTMKDPSYAEIEAFGSPGEMRLTCYPGILWLTFRFNNFGWTDCPYTPHLSVQATDLTKTLHRSCSFMTIVVCNSRNGEVVYSGTVPFNDEMSAAIRAGVMLILGEDFDKDEHYALCHMVQAQYSSEQIANVAIVSYKYERPLVAGQR